MTEKDFENLYRGLESPRNPATAGLESLRYAFSFGAIFEFAFPEFPD